MAGGLNGVQKSMLPFVCSILAAYGKYYTAVTWTNAMGLLLPIIFKTRLSLFALYKFCDTERCIVLLGNAEIQRNTLEIQSSKCKVQQTQK